MIATRDNVNVTDFEAFVAAEGPRLLRFATLLAGPSAAEDLVQSALTNAFVHWRKVRRDQAGAYVRRSIVNAHTSTWRKLRRETALPPEYDVAGPDVYAAVGERAWLHAELRALPATQRAVLLLRYLEGWDDTAIAAAMGIRPASVRSAAHRGLARLRIEIDKPPDTSSDRPLATTAAAVHLPRGT